MQLIAFLAACFASLRSILIVDLMGLDKLTNAFGLLLLFQGVAAAVGSPLAGMGLQSRHFHDINVSLNEQLSIHLDL
jgi:hypothetical protein